MSEVKGWHVATIFVLAFGIIIFANLVLTVNAVRTFPGLEVKNSYVASQVFDKNKKAQLALGWDVDAYMDGDDLVLTVLEDGRAIAPAIEKAIFGHAATPSHDQTPAFIFDGSALRATVSAGPGNWILLLVARSADGTEFQQRIAVGRKR